jgi:hypothetical protein
VITALWHTLAWALVRAARTSAAIVYVSVGLDANVATSCSW